jgi:hypothetical protein
MFSIASAIAAIVGFLRDLLGWKRREEDRQAGRDEVRAEVNAKTLEKKDAMDSVVRPTDDAVSDSMRTGKF